MLPHLGVHRGREHDRAARGQQRAVSRSSARPCGGAGQQVGGGRRDHDQVGGLAEPDVGHLVHVVPDVVARPARPTAPPRSRRRRSAARRWSARPGRRARTRSAAAAAHRPCRRRCRRRRRARRASARPAGASATRRAAVRVPPRSASRAEQALVDLAQRDRQRLLLHVGLDQRADVLQQALAELGVVRVDLPRPLGRHDDQAVLGVHPSSRSSIGGLMMPSPAGVPATSALPVRAYADGGPRIRAQPSF